LEKHPDVLMSKASVTHQGNNLYMQAPPILENKYIDLSLFISSEMNMFGKFWNSVYLVYPIKMIK
jgi:hypothetical protein